MKKIEKINKENLKEIIEKTTELLGGLEELGLEAKIGDISYDSTSFKPKIVISIAGSDDEYAKYFKNCGPLSGLPITLLGQEITFQKEKYKFRGFKPKARKNIVVLENKKGVMFLTSIEAFKSCLPELEGEL